MSESSRGHWRSQYGGVPGDYRTLLVRFEEMKVQNLEMSKFLQEAEARERILKCEYDALLGKVEYENEQLKQELQDLRTNDSDRRETQESKLKSLRNEQLEKDELLTATKKELQSMRSRQREIETYLETVPTPADYTDFTRQFQELKEKNERIVEQNKDLNNKCLEKDKRIQEEVVALKALEDREHILQIHIDDLTDKLSQLSSKKPITRLNRDVIDDLKSDARRWKTNYDIVLQQMNILVKKADERQETFETKLKELKDSLESEKGFVRSFEKLLDEKQSEMMKQRNRITGLVADKQRLLSTLIDVQEKAKMFDEMTEAGWFKKQGTIATSLAECVQDIKNVLRTLNLCVKGERPDYSLLFNIPDKTPALYSNQEFNMTLSFQQLDGSVRQVEELRNDISAIRRLISDRLAENIGSEVTCIVQ